MRRNLSGHSRAARAGRYIRRGAKAREGLSRVGRQAVSDVAMELGLGESGATEAQMPGWRRGLRHFENLFVILPLALSAILPLLEIVLRRFNKGVPGSIGFVQNFTLIIGMAGAAIAARDGRLLSFSSVSSFLKGRAKT